MNLIILVLLLVQSRRRGLCGRYFTRQLLLFYYFFSNRIIIVRRSIYIDTILRNENIESTFTLLAGFQIDSYYFDWRLIHDSLGRFRTVMICLISRLVQFYRFEYIQADPHLPRFISYISLFTFFIVLFINSRNLIIIFIGWEGVGLISFLLISFWSKRVAAIKRGIKAILINKIGDIRLVGRLCLLGIKFGTIEMNLIQVLIQAQSEIDLIRICVLIRRLRKSAQLGFQIWLTDAIEGPTPVSALLHAATIVTAGVLLVLRFSSVFERSKIRQARIIWSAILTRLRVGIFAVMEIDIKKLIALSTANHLRFIFLLCSLSAYPARLFHIINHAFSKALLFIRRGLIIHNIKNEQDIRKLSYIKQYYPVLFSLVYLATSSLARIPFLSLFYSKEIILEILLTNFSLTSTFAGRIIIFFIICTTLVYSTKLVQRIHTNLVSLPYRSRIIVKNLSNRYLSKFIIGLLGSLAIIRLSIGYILNELILYRGIRMFNITSNVMRIKYEFFPWYVKIRPVVLILLGSITIEGSYFSSFKKISIENWYTEFRANYTRKQISINRLKILQLFDKGVFESFIKKIKLNFFSLSQQLIKHNTGAILNRIRWLAGVMLIGVRIIWNFIL